MHVARSAQLAQQFLSGDMEDRYSFWRATAVFQVAKVPGVCIRLLYLATNHPATKIDLAPHNLPRHPERVHPSPSVLPETERQAICATLGALLLDGIDLQCMAKSAHWNARGPLFLELHRLFGKISGALVEHNDNVAERIVTLGGDAVGTCRMVGLGTRLDDYIGGTEPLLDRMHVFLGLAHAARIGADLDTQDLLTQMIRELEKYAWQLLATVQR